MNNLSENILPDVSSVSAEQLIAGERAESYRRQLERPDVFPSKNNWTYIIDNRMESLAQSLYRKYLMAWLTPETDRSDFHDLAIEMMLEYLKVIDRKCAVSTVFDDITTAPDASLHLVDSCRLFDAVTLMKVLHRGGSVGFIADCLNCYQPSYTDDDLHDMRSLLRQMQQLPAVGCVEDKHSIFGHDLRYICANGHSNSSNQEFCSQCGENIQGLTAENVAAIDRFDKRIAVLTNLLDKLPHT